MRQQRSSSHSVHNLQVHLVWTGPPERYKNRFSYPPSLSVSDLAKRLKGRSAKLLLVEYPELKRRYWAGPPGRWSSLAHRLWSLERRLDHR